MLQTTPWSSRTTSWESQRTILVGAVAGNPYTGSNIIKNFQVVFTMDLVGKKGVPGCDLELQIAPTATGDQRWAAVVRHISEFMLHAVWTAQGGDPFMQDL